MEKIYDFTIDCPYCGKTTKPIPKDMGDQKVKCTRCGKYMIYRHRKQRVDGIEKPDRNSGSGTTIY